MKVPFTAAFLTAIFLLLTGCREEKKMESDPVSVPPQKEKFTPKEELENASFLCYADSMYVGSEKRQIFRVGETLEVENFSGLEVKRYGRNVTASVTHSERLAKNGRFLGSRTQIEMGGVPMVYEAAEPVLDGRKLTLEVKVQSQNLTQTQNVETVLPEGVTPDAVSGGYGVETGLMLQPLKLGETRRLVRFNPTMLRWERVDLHAKGAEDVKLPNGAEFPLLRVETHSQMLKADGSPDPAQTQNETLWCDGKGLIWKRFSPLMNLASWRVSKAELAHFTQTGQYPPAPTGEKPANELEKSFDFAENLNVPLKLTEGKTADFVNDAEGTYTVSAVENESIRGLFESSDFQKVEAVDDFHLKITVRNSTGERFTDASEPPTPDETNAGPMIQSDAPEIAALAQMVLPGETDVAKLAPALERFVFGFIVNKNYARGFVTALEVATNPSGDCTEHAVLLAALARNRKIPARIVQGLIFEKDSGKMAWHVWNELYVNGRWVPFDATLGKGFVGVNHLRINAGSFSTATLAGTLMPAAKLIGKIRIEY
ncbi:MAG: transglutaminase domain-containing protein [Thermoguttaceae bacterium]|nr:transglutaminase domain-containing protein [Thermoguttaceae bacterium]